MGAEPGSRLATLKNPVSEEFDALRPSLLPDLLLSAQFNCRRGASDVFLFESGWAHQRGTDGLPVERFLIAGVALGSRWSRTWNADPAWRADFFTIKGVVEGLLELLGIAETVWAPAEVECAAAGGAAICRRDGEALAFVGELKADLAEELDLPAGALVVELDGDALQARWNEERKYAPPSRFPAVARDLAFVVSEATPAAALREAITAELSDWAREIRLFDRYAGKSLGAGRVSLGFRLLLGAADRTLTDAEVDARLEQVKVRLAAEFGAELRG